MFTVLSIAIVIPEWIEYGKLQHTIGTRSCLWIALYSIYSWRMIHLLGEKIGQVPQDLKLQQADFAIFRLMFPRITHGTGPTVTSAWTYPDLPIYT